MTFSQGRNRKGTSDSTPEKNKPLEKMCDAAMKNGEKKSLGLLNNSNQLIPKQKQRELSTVPREKERAGTRHSIYN